MIFIKGFIRSILVAPVSALIGVCWIYAFPVASQTTTTAGPFGDFFTHPSVECLEIPVLERGRFTDCAALYLRDDLPKWLRAAELARDKRIEAARAKVWEWFRGAPNVNCETTPTLEREKFLAACEIAAVGGNLLPAMQRELENIRRERSRLSQRIEDMRSLHERLVARASAAGFERDGEIRQSLEVALGNLDASLQQVQLMERLSVELAKLPHAPKLSGIEFERLPGGIAIAPTPETLGSPIAQTAKEGELAIILHPQNSNNGVVAIVHLSHGIGYVIEADIAGQ